MAKVNASEYADKWKKNMTNAVPYIRAGVEKVTESPMKKAAAKQEKMLNNLTESITTGKWKRGLEAVTLEDWRRKFVDKGVNRIADGAAGAVPKMQAFAEKLLPFQDSLQGKIKAMPDDTFEQRINRATEWIRGMHGFKK